MEDYEKKYKDALAKAREIHRNENEKKFDMEWLFPELKESEDEKIRKRVLFSLQKDFMATKNSGCDTQDLEQCIAWLEKQGSSSVKWQKNTPDNKPAINHTVLMKTTIGIVEGEWQGEHWFQYRWSCRLKDNEVLYWMELSDLDEQGEQKPFDYEHATITQKDFAPKQGEQKPADNPISREEILYQLVQNGTITAFDYLYLTRRSEPQPAWSDEDETIRENIEGALDYYEGMVAEDWEKEKEWLKFIKNRIER